MSNRKHTENDPERTLITLDQLSQTIEVMTSVVNRLRQHLSEQIQARKAEDSMAELAAELQQTGSGDSEATAEAAAETSTDLLDEIEVEVPVAPRTLRPASPPLERESFIVEITRHEAEIPVTDEKVLH